MNLRVVQIEWIEEIHPPYAGCIRVWLRADTITRTWDAMTDYFNSMEYWCRDTFPGSNIDLVRAYGHIAEFWFTDPEEAMVFRLHFG